MKKYIGIDLGGTNIRVAKITEAGEVLIETKAPSHALEGAEVVYNHLVELVRSIPNLEECSAIGIGVPGPVDTKNGVMLMATNLPGFENFPLKKRLEKEFGMPCFIDNDANVAGLAEALLGAGIDASIVYYITQSTGIGGALVIDGHVVSGKHGYAGEIGNIVVRGEGEKINHLNIGAVENVASGVALARIGKKLIGPYITSARDVFELAEQGNNTATKIIDQMAYDFALLCANIAHVVDPDVFVLGGGVTRAASQYLDKVVSIYQGLVHEKMRDTKFVLAALDEPGILGAAMLPVSNGV